MWVEKRNNGKYKAVERYTDYLTGKQRKVSVRIEKNTAQTRKIAQMALNEKIDKIMEGRQDVEHKSLTLSNLIDQRREVQKLTLKASTCRRNYFSENLIMNAFGKDTLVEKLNANYIKNTLVKLDKTNEQRNEILKRFKAVLNWGYENELIEDVSYLQKLKKFNAQPHREKIEDKYLESDEVKLLLSEMKVDVWRGVTRMLVLSGLRFGELVALKKEEVDFKNRVIWVNDTYDPNNSVTTSAKTDDSVREVYMQDELLKSMKELNMLMLHQKLLCGYSTSTIFLTDKKGEHIKYYAFNKYLKENSFRVLGREITPHVLRHTHVSLLAENGVDIEDISRRIGHSDSKITREIYLHVTKKRKARVNAKLNELKII